MSIHSLLMKSTYDLLPRREVCKRHCSIEIRLNERFGQIKNCLYRPRIIIQCMWACGIGDTVQYLIYVQWSSIERDEVHDTFRVNELLARKIVRNVVETSSISRATSVTIYGLGGGTHALYSPEGVSFTRSLNSRTVCTSPSRLNIIR